MCSAVAMMFSLTAAHAMIFDDLIPSDDNDKDWVEIEPALPDPPKDQDLVPFYVSPVTQFRFFIDTRSLTVGTDKVVHYTLVARSPSGAQNVSFEGMHCGKRQLKVYAYLGPKGFDPRTAPTWTRITEAESNRQRASLYKDYFCGTQSVARTADLIRALKANPYDQLGP